MIRISGLTMSLDYTMNTLRKKAAGLLRLPEGELRNVSLFKRSVDARHKDRICFQVSLDVTVAGDEEAVVRRCRSPKITRVTPVPFVIDACSVKPRYRPVVVGGGPAGLFAALYLARAGLAPLLLERGRAVEARQKDVERFRYTGVLDTASNVQFGEGGAGAFSDGKLNTGIKDGRCRFVLEELVKAGAPEEILWEAKPHVGTDRLQKAVRGLREEILRLGGQVLFSHTVTALRQESGHVTALTVQTPDGAEDMLCDQVIFAIGHSARDTMRMLYDSGLPMEKKAFAVGVRIEHPRALIDAAQYGAFAAHPALGAADYKLACHPATGRGVYSFCMCPGGVVIAAASETGGVAVNGMSEFARDAENSNSALLVGVLPEDMPGDHPLAGITLQRQMEQAAFRLGGKDYRAPVQLVGDFLKGVPSARLGDIRPSYRPGVVPCDLRECLPGFVADSLKTALPAFGRQLIGFDRYDAVMTGVESRSSSPVRMLRDAGGQSVVRGVYPCGEGAGYAGGITSAAVDGMRCAAWLIDALREE